MPAPVHIVPLGGLGEVGMNCLAVESAGRIAVIDCGVLFTDEPFGVDVITPDLTWLLSRREQVGAVFLTHGHEDHVGALPFLLRHLPVPVYGTRFTLADGEGAAGRGRDLPPTCARWRRATSGRPARPRRSAAEFIAVTHSIPDACALALTTPQGVMIHSGDFKIDEHPVRGPGMDLDRLEALGRAGVRLLLSDSTNAERPGWALSESAVGPGLLDVMAEATGRVFVATFSSNAHRLQQVVEAAAASGRRLALLGRGMVENFELARALGYARRAGLDAGDRRRGPAAAAARAGHPHHRLPGGAARRAGPAGARRAPRAHGARRRHGGPLLPPDPRQRAGGGAAGQRAVRAAAPWCAGKATRRSTPPATPRRPSSGGSSSSPGPSGSCPSTASTGSWRATPPTPPPRGSRRSAATCSPTARCWSSTTLGAQVLPARVHSGRVAISRDEGGAVEVPDAVLDDRRRLAEFGLCVAVVQVDAATGAVLAGPEFHARGVAGLDGREAELRAEVLAALAEVAGAGGEARREALRLAVRRWFRRTTGRRPMVEPVVLER